jgi:hypothetical protein
MSESINTTFLNKHSSVLVLINIMSESINTTILNKHSSILALRGKRFTVCTEITIILGMVRFMIRGGRLRYKRYDAHFFKKRSVELLFSSFGDHLINILRKVN